MPDKLAARLIGHAEMGEQAVGRALEAALAAQRFFDAASEKQQEAVRHLTDAGAAFASVRAAATSAVPPAEAGARRTDSVRALVALSVGLLGGALACGDRSLMTPGVVDVAKKSDSPGRDHEAAGLQALKDGKLVLAEHEFTEAGDRGRLAEVYNRQGRYDEAIAQVCSAEDGQAKLMLALAHQSRGEFGEYRRRLVEARNLGNVPALRLLEQHDAGG